ncbi:MAG: hypothetical protein V1694_09245 [Candidatus Eisenbacteria bacterium]
MLHGRLAGSEAKKTTLFGIGRAKYRPAFDVLVILVWAAAVSWATGQIGLSATTDQGIIVETVRKDSPGWNRLLARFSAELLNEGDQIENPEALVFQRRAFLSLLWANPDGKLAVRRDAYGVRIWYDSQGMCPFAGSCSYIRSTDQAEEIQPADEVEAQRWDENRRAVYRGSYAHFLRALMHERLREEGFEVLNPDAFVGLFRKGDGFVLVASPYLRVQVPPEKTIGTVTLNHGWLSVNNNGSAGGSWGIGGVWNWLEFIPRTVLGRYAEEQDKAWGKETSTIQQVLSLK